MTLKNVNHTLIQEGLQKYLDELQTKKSLFSKLMTAVLTFALNRNLKKAEVFKSKFYKFNEIKLYNFIECLVNKDYTYLYKDKIKKRNEIAEQLHFESLLLQFTESTGDISDFQTIIDFYNTLAKIRILEASGNIIFNLSPETKRILKRIGIKLTGDYERDMLQIAGKLATLNRTITELGEKLETSKSNAEKTMSFEYFSGCILSINITLKINCSLQTISLREFCTYYKRTKEAIEWQKKQLTK